MNVSRSHQSLSPSLSLKSINISSGENKNVLCESLLKDGVAELGPLISGPAPLVCLPV